MVLIFFFNIKGLRRSSVEKCLSNIDGGAYGLSPKMQGVEDKICPVLTKDLSWIPSTNFR